MRRFDKHRMAPKPDLNTDETDQKLQELIQMRQQQDQLYSYTQKTDTQKTDIYKTDIQKTDIQKKNTVTS